MFPHYFLYTLVSDIIKIRTWCSVTYVSLIYIWIKFRVRINENSILLPSSFLIKITSISFSNNFLYIWFFIGGEWIFFVLCIVVEIVLVLQFINLHTIYVKMEHFVHSKEIYVHCCLCQIDYYGIVYVVYFPIEWKPFQLKCCFE